MGSNEAKRVALVGLGVTWILGMLAVGIAGS
jgi:hypothetical protein